MQVRPIRTNQGGTSTARSGIPTSGIGAGSFVISGTGTELDGLTLAQAGITNADMTQGAASALAEPCQEGGEAELEMSMIGSPKELTKAERDRLDVDLPPKCIPVKVRYRAQVRVSCWPAGTVGIRVIFSYQSGLIDQSGNAVPTAGGALPGSITNSVVSPVLIATTLHDGPHTFIYCVPIDHPVPVYLWITPSVDVHFLQPGEGQPGVPLGIPDVEETGETETEQVLISV